MNRPEPSAGRGGSPGEGPVELALEAACAGPAPLLRPEEPVLVACSGGADSVALAAALGDRAAGSLRASLRVAVGHVDHGLREGSAAEAGQVSALAARLGLPFFSERLPDLAAAIARDGLEAAARKARYAALARLAAASGSAAVATAHTRSDQAETVLLRLFRGGGPGALSGVRPSRPLAAPAGAPGPLRLVRPLLKVSRADTEACCRARGLDFVRDPHNLDPRRARARVRAELPRLAELLNPRLEETLAGAAALAADEDDLLAGLAAAELARARRDGGVCARTLLALHPALRRRCLLTCAVEAGVRPERGHLERLAALLDRREVRLDLPGGRAEIDGGVLRFHPRPP